MTNNNFSAANSMAAASAIMLQAGEAITASVKNQAQKGTHEADGCEQFHLNSNLFPCVCVAMYESPLSPGKFEEDMNEREQEYGYEFNYVTLDWQDWTKELTKVANEYIQENIIDVLRNYGVLKIEATGIYSPKYYNYGTDELNMDITMAAGWRDIMAEKVAAWQGDKEIEFYIKKHYRSCSGYVNFMPESLQEILTEDDEDRQLAAYLTLALVAECALDDMGDGSRSLWELAEIMDSDFSDYQTINVLREYYDDEQEADDMEALWQDDDRFNELYWQLADKIGFQWLHDKDSKRLDGKKDCCTEFHADSDGKRMLFWAVKNGHTVSDLYSMAA